MNAKTKRTIILLLAALMVTAGFVISSYAKQASKGKKGGQTIGWCCKDGKVLKSTHSVCVKQNGHFFTTQKAAETYLDAHTPGWCYLNGKVTASKKGDCLKTKGQFFEDKTAAADYCKINLPGYCCINGKVIKTVKGKCLEEKGHFFGKKDAAVLSCEMNKPGYCCVNGKLSPMKKGDCLKKKGTFYKDKQAALKACEPMGWCLLNGRIFETTQKKCQMRRGRFFTKKGEAQKVVRLAKQGKKTSQAPAASGKTTPQALAAPLLSVERIYLKGGIVHIRVQNKGKGKLTVGDYKEGKFVLRYGGREKSWGLKGIDPKRRLVNPGGALVFDTGLALGKREKIRVAFEKVKAKTFRPVIMSPKTGPMMAKATVKGKAKTARSISRKKIKKPVKETAEPSEMQFQAKPLERKPGPSRPVPVILERGIYISQPNGGAYHRMQSLHVFYTITREVDDDTAVIISLRNRNNASYIQEIRRTTAGEVRAPQEFDWTIPLSASYGTQYYIHAEAGALRGESNFFSIEEDTSLVERDDNHGIAVSLLPRQPHYAPGETISVRFRYTTGVPDGACTVYLHLREDGLERLSTSSWHRLGSSISGGSYNRETGEYTIPVTLPSSLSHSADSWVISAVQRPFWGRSHSFSFFVKESPVWGAGRSLSVDEITAGGGSSPIHGISIIYPNGGEHLTSCCGNRYEFQWHHWEPGVPPTTSIVLQRSGRDVHTWRINSEDISFDEISKICSVGILLVGTSSFFPPGDDYSIRITTRGGYSDESGTFTIGGPLNVEGPYDEDGRSVDTLYWWNRYQIRWRMLTRLSGNVDIYLINGGAENRVARLGSAPTGSEMFRFWVPALYGNRILVVAEGSDATYSLSREFRHNAPRLSITAPTRGSRWHNGERHGIRWTSEHLPTAMPYAPHERLTLSIYLTGGPHSIREHIIRGFPADRGFYSWRVAYGSTVTYGDPGSPEGAGVPGAGTMGGVPDTLPAGNYRIVLQLDQGGMISQTEEFRID